MGVVYVAEHDVMKRKAVVKVLRKELTGNEEIARRFINEATAAASIRHPGIVDVMDVGTHDTGVLYILMEHLDGESLAERIRRVGALPVDQSVAVIRQAAAALGVAHNAGIVHRDLKPDNLFIIPDPEDLTAERVKLLDFGIAKLGGDGMGSLVTRTGAMMGTPVYMSPEQCRGAGQVDLRTDIYSFGCILFEMLVGRPPFIGEGIGDLISAHMTTPPPPLRSFDATLPASVDAVVARLLQKKPDERYASCEELIAALDALPPFAGASSAPAPEPARVAASSVTTLGVAAGVRDATVTNTVRRELGRPRLGIPAALAGVGIVAVVAVVALSGGREPEPVPAAADVVAATTDAAAGALAPAPDAPPDPNAARYAAFEAAVRAAGEASASAETLAEVGPLYRAIDAGSDYAERGRADHDRVRDRYIAMVAKEANRLARKSSRCDFDEMAARARTAWPEAGDAVDESQKACVAKRAKRAKPPKTNPTGNRAGGDATSKNSDELATEAGNSARNGNYGRALKLCEDALDLEPSHSHARAVCTISACMVNHAAKAKRHYSRLSSGAKRLAASQCAKAGLKLE